MTFITARVRSTTGRYCFHRCLSVHRGGRGGPVRYPPGGTEVRVPPPGGVTQTSVPPGGYPDFGTPPGGPGTPRGGTQTSVPPPGGVRVPPPPPRGGGGTRVRYPPQGGYRSPGTPPGGYLTRVGQQKEYSLHGGRYASCVHAGGLSCYNCKLFNNSSNQSLTEFVVIFSFMVYIIVKTFSFTFTV